MLVEITFFAILAIYTVCVYRKPARAAGGVFCLYGLKQWGQAESAFLAEHRTIANFAFAAVVVFAWLIAKARGRAANRYSSVAHPLFALLALALVSFLWCIYPPAYLGMWIYATPYLIVFVVLAPLLIGDLDDAVTAIWTLFVLGFLLIFLLQYTTTWRGREIQFEDVANGFIKGNPLAVGSLAASVFLIALLVHVERWKRVWAVVRWPIALQALFTTVQTGSRGQAIVAMICAVIFSPLSRGLKTARQLATLCAASIFLVVAAYCCYSALIENNSRWDYSTMASDVETGRIDRCEIALDRWQRGGPWTMFFGFGSSGCFSPDVNGSYLEVVPAEILCEEGIVGAILWLTMVVLMFRTLFRAGRLVSESPRHRGILAAIGALAVFQLILSCKEGNFLGQSDGLAWIVILGQFGEAVHRNIEAAYWSENEPALAYLEQNAVLDPYSDLY